MRGRELRLPAPGGHLVAWHTGDGPPVLLIHGGPGLGCGYMADLVDELAPEFHVAVFQQRGVEPSTREGPFDIGRAVADVPVVLDGLGWRRAWLAGHSFGALVMLFAMIDVPDRVLGGLAIDPLGAVGDGGWEAFDASLRERLPSQDVARSGEINDRAFAGEASDAEYRESWRLAWPAYFAVPAEAPPFPDDLEVGAGPARMVASLGSELPRLQAALGSIAAPFGCVAGAESPLPAALAGGATAEAIPGGWLEVVQGAGHGPWIERPGSVLAALRRLTSA